jgi:hypothetical protein
MTLPYPQQFPQKQLALAFQIKTLSFYFLRIQQYPQVFAAA